MTVTSERTVARPRRQPATAAPPRRQHGAASRRAWRRAPALPALGAILACAWVVSGFWTSVELRSPRADYPAPTAGQVWVRAPENWPRAFFRLRVALSSDPLSAVLFLEADQQVTPFVNGLRITIPPPSPNHTIDTPNDIPRVVQTLDLGPALHKGGNIVGLEVVNDHGGLPEFRARLVVDGGGAASVFGTSPGAWLATSDVSLTSQLMPESGAFSAPGLDDGGWAPASAGPAAPATPDAVPPDAYLQPALRPALTGPPGAATVRASTRVVFPPGCDEGWMRVAASGPWSVALDGHLLATGTGGPVRFGSPDIYASASVHTPRVLQMNVDDLCPVVTPGSHVISVTVSSSTLPAIYLDGLVRAGAQTVSFGTGTGWRQGPDASPGAAPSLELADPQLRLGLFERVQADALVPSSGLLAHRLRLVLVLLASAAVAGCLARLTGATGTSALRAVAAGSLPAAGLVLVLVETEHIVYVVAPFPDTPALLAAVLAVAGCGLALAVLAPAWRPALGALSQRARAAAGARMRRARAVPGALVRRARTTPAVEFVGRRPYEAVVIAFALAWGAVQCYDLGFEPMWQDELSSLGAGQAIRAHLLPRWPSGFLYWKSELYSSLIAAVGWLTHDNVSSLRSIATGFFAATVALFGLGLAPLVLPGRRIYQLVATVVFATAPFELGHARDVRMYQAAQFFVVLLAILLWRALREPTTPNVALTMGAAVAMYLTHEETFGVLAVVPLVLVVSSGMRFLSNWRWWAFGGAALAVIAAQLGLAYLTHPPSFGIDASSGSLVAWSPAPFFYIDQFFFTRVQSGASITVVSLLALTGIALGLHRRVPERCYLAAFLVVPVVVVTLLLPAKDTRYAFITLPFDFALAAAGTADLLDAASRAAGAVAGTVARLLQGVFAALVVAAIGLSLIGGIGDYGVLVARVTHSDYAHRWFDYPRADAYVKSHLEPGDGVIAASSLDLVADSLRPELVGWIPYHRSSTLLYLIEQHGKAVDTEYGIPAILNGIDFEISIDSRHRTWLVVADDDISGLLPAERALLESRFRLAEEGEQVSVFLATN